MRCSRCGICCEKTEMLLSTADIRLLEEAGHNSKKFVCFNRRGLAQLRNRRGYCVFYDAEKHFCSVHRYRPLGCRIYPVIYSEEEGVIVDDLCPMMNTVSAAEVKRKAKRLMKLLHAIDREAEKLDRSV
jgi:Fe-S-cluster containining protein